MLRERRKSDLDPGEFLRQHEDHWVTATGMQKAWRETGRDGKVWSKCPQEDVKLALPNDVGKRKCRDLVIEMGS